jgi:hypothetical protein
VDLARLGQNLWVDSEGQIPINHRALLVISLSHVGPGPVHVSVWQLTPCRAENIAGSRDKKEQSAETGRSEAAEIVEIRPFDGASSSLFVNSCGRRKLFLSFWTASETQLTLSTADPGRVLSSALTQSSMRSLKRAKSA